MADSKEGATKASTPATPAGLRVATEPSMDASTSRPRDVPILELSAINSSTRQKSVPAAKIELNLSNSLTLDRSKNTGDKFMAASTAQPEHKKFTSSAQTFNKPSFSSARLLHSNVVQPETGAVHPTVQKPSAVPALYPETPVDVRSFQVDVNPTQSVDTGVGSGFNITNGPPKLKMGGERHRLEEVDAEVIRADETLTPVMDSSTARLVLLNNGLLMWGR